MKHRFDIGAMRQRLRAKLTEKGLTMRQVSLDANCGPGYLHSVLEEGKEPTIGRLADICHAAGISMSFVLLGFDISPETERFISVMEANPAKRDSILDLLTS